MIDSTLQASLRERFNPDGSMLRTCQLRMLDMLLFLDRVCRENGLKYWLDSGTLIGAARHGGFIPWDDDVDICMMRRDADTLSEILADKVWEGHIVLQNDQTDPHYVNPSWMSLRDLDSEFRTDTYYHRKLRFKGLQIDIFIIEEGIPPRVLDFSSKLHSLLVLSPLIGRHHLGWLRSLSFFNYRLLKHTLYPLLALTRKKNSGMTSSGFGATFSKIQPYSNILPLSSIEFEGHSFYAPHDTDAYLTRLFGSWRSLPNIDSIKGHEAQIILQPTTDS